MVLGTDPSRLRVCSVGSALLLAAAVAAGGALLRGARRAAEETGPSGAGAATLASADSARATPLEVRPLVRGLLPLAEAQRRWLRRQIQPPAGERISVSYCYHWLRVHGRDPAARTGPFPSRDAALELLTDQQAGEAYFGRPPVVRTRSGARFPTADADAAAAEFSLEAHRDQGLATLAELGVPLTHPLRIAGETFPLREVLRDSLANFHLGQEELTWTALAYALYLPPANHWVNRYGESFSFDDVVGELLGRPLDKASCAGTHLLYSLTILARVDRQMPVLSGPVRDRLWERLGHSVDVARRTQDAGGFWRVDWNRELLGAAPAEGWSRPPDLPWTRLLATGHLAEWMLYLPPEVRPPADDLRRAGRWLYRQLHTHSAAQLQEWFCPCAHAVCVLRQLADGAGDDPPG
jgi:hypothetical protein